MAIEIESLNRVLGKIPQHPFHDAWVKVHQAMVVHTMGAEPTELLCTRRPNEAPEVYDYRLSIYEPITKGAINRAIDQLYRIFLNTNFSVAMSEDLTSHLAEKRYNRKEFMSYIQQDVLKRMIEDPNGLLVWMPSGPGLTDPSQKVEVEPLLIDSSDILVIDQDKVIIKIGGDKVNRTFLTLDDTAIYTHTETKRGGSFSWQLVYTHNMGRIPVVRLGGNTTEDGFFESYFSPFLPFANEAIRQYSDWQAVMVTSAFPYREEVAEDCDNPACVNGSVPCDSDDCQEDFTECSRCSGSGLKRQKSPYGVFTRPRANGALEEVDTRPSISFIAPPVEILEYSQQSWQTLLKNAEEALHLKFTDEAQSGVAKIIDRENQYSFLSKVCGTVFDGHIKQSLWILERYRNITAPQDPVVIKPANFTVKSEQDLVNEITELKSKSAPSPFIIAATKDLAKRRFHGDDIQSRMIDVIVAYDPLFHLTISEKSELSAAGGITQDDVIKSTHAYTLMLELVAEVGDTFLALSVTQIKAALDTKLAPIISKSAPVPLIS